MTEYRRQLMLTLCDNDMRIPPILHQLDAYVRCDEVLQWLIKHRFIGNELFLLVRHKYSNSVQSLVKDVLRRLNKDSENKPIFYGKDWLK